jgi:hypothetical protein
MAELAIAIPEPIAEDPENVVTALETAALFGARGDASEALRWVRHAATSAGDSGNDSRALDLARAAADLTPPPPEVAVRPRSLPVPPSRPRSMPPPLPSVDDASTASARPPPPSASRPQERASHPPPPSSVPSTARSESPRSAPSVAPRASQAPRPWPQASERPSVAARERPSVAPRERPSVAARERPSVAPRERLSVAPSERSSVVPHAAVLPKERTRAAHSESSTGARNAARVSVMPGAEPGVFAVRVLTDGAPLPDESLEAYLVLVDPTAALLPNR